MPTESRPLPNHSSALLTRRIRTLAVWGEVTCGLALVLAVGAVGLGLLDGGWRDRFLFGGFQLNGGLPVQLSVETRKAMMLVILPAVGCQLFALWSAMALFRGYRQGEIFTPSAARQMGKIGWALFAMAPIDLITRVAFNHVASGTQPGGIMSASLSVTDLDFSVIGFGLIAILAAKVLAEASRVAEENKLFI